MGFYRKKPVVIEAQLWMGSRSNLTPEFCDAVQGRNSEGKGFISTLEGVHEVSVGDYIIKGVKGEFYACKPDIFHMTYEEVRDGIP